MKALYPWTSVAPARIRCQASSAVSMPPTPTQGDPVAHARVEAAQDLQGALLERRPGQAAGLLHQRGRRPQAEALARDGGVGGDDAVEAQLQRRGRRRRRRPRRREIGSDLHQQRDAPVRDRAVRGLAHGGEQRTQVVHRLEVAQAGRVRRGDVDDEVVRVRREALGGLHVVGDGLRLRDDLGLADVDADHGLEDGLTGGQAGRHGERAVIVEAHAVDERAVRDEPEQPLLGVAGLRLPRHRADLDVVEAQHRHAVDGDRVLVEARGEPEGAVHAQPEGLGAQLLVPGARGRRRRRCAAPGCGRRGGSSGRPGGGPAPGPSVGRPDGRRACTCRCPHARGTPFPVSPLGAASRGPRSGVGRCSWRERTPTSPWWRASIALDGRGECLDGGQAGARNGPRRRCGCRSRRAGRRCRRGC